VWWRAPIGLVLAFVSRSLSLSLALLCIVTADFYAVGDKKVRTFSREALPREKYDSRRWKRPRARVLPFFFPSFARLSRVSPNGSSLVITGRCRPPPPPRPRPPSSPLPPLICRDIRQFAIFSRCAVSNAIANPSVSPVASVTKRRLTINEARALPTRARAPAYFFSPNGFRRASRIDRERERARDTDLSLHPLLALSVSPASLSLPSSRGFRSFRESMRRPIDRGTRRKIPPRLAPRVATTPPRVLTDIFLLQSRAAPIGGDRHGARHGGHLRSILARSPDAGNQTIPVGVHRGENLSFSLCKLPVLRSFF